MGHYNQTNHGDDDMTTFASIEIAGGIHYNTLQRGLVLGFMTTDYRNNLETLYYLNKDAEMFTSGPQTPGPNFKARAGWTKIDIIDRSAEFIGHYSL